MIQILIKAKGNSIKLYCVIWIQYSWIWRGKKLHVQTYNTTLTVKLFLKIKMRLEIKSHTCEEDGVHFRMSLSFIDELEK